MASARVGSPMASCQCSTGSWLVTMVEARPWRSSRISSRSRRCGGGEDGEAPVVDDQHIHAGDGFEDAFMAAPVSRTGATGKSEGFEPARGALIEPARGALIEPARGALIEPARGALIEDGPPVPASLVAEGAGDPAFAKTGGAGDQQVLLARNPAAIRKMGHDTAVKAAWRAQVQIFDAGILAQGGEFKAGRQLLIVSFCRLAVDQQAGAIFKRKIIEGGRPALLVKRARVLKDAAMPDRPLI